MSLGASGLAPDEFWTDPYRTRDAIEDGLLARREEKTLVDAPPEVVLDQRDSAPVLVLRVASNATMQERPFRPSAIVTVVDVTRNLTYANLALEPSSRGGLPEKPSGPAPEGWSGEAFVVDARTRVDLPWAPGEYLVTLLLGDTPSARLPVTFRHGKAPDAAVEQFHREERERTRLPALYPPPGVRWPQDQRDDETPAVPADIGIALSAPRVKVVDKKVPTLLRGSFRVHLQPRHLVVPGPEASRLQQQVGPGRPLPTALVPLTLVATGTEEPTPFVWSLVLPVFEQVDPAARAPVVSGTFVVNLDTLGAVQDVEQTLFLYAFSDTAMAGPVPVAFTTPEPLE